MKPLSLQGHTRALTRVRINNDGDLLFTASKDKSPCVWFMENGELVGTYQGHTGAIADIDVSWNTKMLASASADQSVKTGKEIGNRTLNTPGHSVSTSYSGHLLAYTTTKVGNKPSMLAVIDLRDSNQLKNKDSFDQLMLNDGSSRCVFSHLDDKIITGSDKGTLNQYDLRNFTDAVNFTQSHKGTIKDLQMSHDQGLIISSSSDHTAILHDAESLKKLKTYEHGRPVNSAAISPTHDYIVLGGGEEAMQVTQTGAASGQFEAKLYHIVYEKIFAFFKGHFGPINTLAFSPDGSTIVTGSEDGFVRIQEMDQEYFDYDPIKLPDMFKIYWPKINQSEEDVEGQTMFDSSSSSAYRRLNRGGNGFTRNVTFFGILVGLVIVFSVFYLYISASNDSSALRFELNSQSEYVTKLKNEILGLNTKIEELKSIQSTCKESQTAAEQRNEECSKNLIEAKENFKLANDEKSKVNTDLETLKTKNRELSTALDAQKANMSAMQTVGVSQEAIVIKLNETIDALRRDLILKDEIIKKLESGQTKDLQPEAKNKEAIVEPPNLEKPSITTTKSAVVAPPPAADSPDALAIPGKAQPGDRVKIEEANQKKEADGALLRAAAQQQDEEVAAIDPPIAQMDGAKSGEI